MASHGSAPLRPVVVGANHRSSALAIRDRLFVADEDVPALLAALRAAGVDQALLLSTCDRVEVTAAVGDADRAASAISHVLAAHARLSPAELVGELYVHRDAPAVRHLFGVASSLDSQVVGEPHVLGQVKEGHAASVRAGMAGGELEALLQAAYAVAKRVRTETGIGRRAVSIAAAAVETAHDVHGDLGRCALLLIGAGDMGQMVVDALAADGIGRLTVSHPSAARAERMARALGCHAAPFADLAAALAAADIVVAALGARRSAVTGEMVRAALKRRRNRPIFLIDAGIPGDVDPAVERLDEAFRFGLDDLERVALAGRAHREQEAAAAWRIVDGALADYLRARQERAAAPVLEALHRRFDAIRRGAVADSGGDADKATRLLVGRLLHGPATVLRDLAAGAGDNGVDLAAVERALAEVFALKAGDDGDEDR